MKRTTTVLATLAMMSFLLADDAAPALKERLKHQQGSTKLAGAQDELSADVQDLIEEQTNEKVIVLLEQVEEIMAEVTDELENHDTGGATIAAETDIIEKIFEAAKEKQSGGQSPEGKKSMGAMLEMMQRMMGQQPGGDKPGDKPGNKPGNKGGEGMKGESDTANTGQGKGSAHPTGERMVPKSAGVSGTDMPEEFRKALDAYNRPSSE